MFGQTLTDGSRWVAAPYIGESLTTGSITGIYVPPNKTVHWKFTVHPDGTKSVTGYELQDITKDTLGGANE